MKLSQLLLGALYTLLSLSVYAQSIDSLEVIRIRELALDQYPLQHQRMMEVFGLHDQMPSKDKLLMERYDSLTRDSVFMQSPAFRTVAIDRALLAMSKGNAQAQFSPLKIAFGDVQLPEGLSPYHQEVSAVLLEFALAAEDYATAYRMQNALHAAAYSQWKSEGDALADSTRQAELKHTRQLQEIAEKQKITEKEQHNVRTILMVIAGVLLLASVIFLWMMLNGRKQLLGLRNRVEDTSEKEELVHKLEAAKRELQQHLLMEKKKVEPVVVAAPVSAAPVIDLSSLNDEIQQGLSKIKAHCEAGKQGMSVPTYMSIINDTTRLSSAVMKRIQTLNSTQSKS